MLYWQADNPFVAEPPPSTLPPDALVGDVAATLSPPRGDPEWVELLRPPGDKGSPVVVVVAAEGDKEHPYADESP